MKKILFILSFCIFFIGCSGSNDEPTLPDEIVTIPENIIGDWKVSYYSNESTGSLNNTNDKGYYIKFNKNNTISLKDVNGEFTGHPYHSGKGTDYYVYSNINNDAQMYIIVQSYSNWFPGGYEFSISYSNNFNKMKFYAKKQ